MSKRGQTVCPGCNTSFNNRYKPENCDNCNHFLGGKYIPKPKKCKLTTPNSVKLFSKEGCSFFSVKTHFKDTRCIVIVDDDNNCHQCLTARCKEVRAAFVNSGKAEQFSCEHTALCKNAVPPMNTFSLTDELISSYPCDKATKEALNNLKHMSTGTFDVFQVSSVSFCVNGAATASNSVGFCHVKKVNSTFVCTSADCGRFASKTKAVKHKKICMHVHVLLCILKPDSDAPDCGTSNLHTVGPTSTSSTSENTTEVIHPEVAEESTGRQSTVKMKMQKTLPYCIPQEILHKILVLDSKSVLHGVGVDGWPSVYIPTEDLCSLCGTSLSSARPHPGQKLGDSGFLITNAVPFENVKILVKQCVNVNCKAIVQVFPYDLGLFNISDKLLVSFDLLLEWREEFKRGVAPTLAIESKLAILSKKSARDIPASTTLEYFTDLLYSGFYCFEAITERNLDSVICGICGVVGEVYLGDGNEKNCCSRKEISYNQEDSGDSNHILSLEDLLERIKYHWVERTTFTRSAEPFSVNAFSLPPIIPPKLRGESVFNTESKKKTYSVNKGKSKMQGDPALLHIQIRDFNVDMQSLENLSLQALRDLCEKCDIPVSSHKSQQALRGELQQLYGTLLLGDSPCHGFTQVPGKTGGFYHLVCRHGITVASKFLTIQESVRDAADLYLSLKYPPPVFICDTPCGFVRHLDCRNKDIASKLWGNNSGCFEAPSIGKSPEEGVNVPQIVPAEFKLVSSDFEAGLNVDRWVHPITGVATRYVLGDRFHSATNPHKSPLCAFHDINLCLQANAIKTSYQEAENSRKNKKRLQSACIQGFGTHYFYNFLMDFYQNEQIVNKQLSILRKNNPHGAEIVRDNFMRFVYVQVKST